jgi:hypothetical protein
MSAERPDWLIVERRDALELRATITRLLKTIPSEVGGK